MNIDSTGIEGMYHSINGGWISALLSIKCYEPSATAFTTGSRVGQYCDITGS